jgi:hypothetical protein
MKLEDSITSDGQVTFLTLYTGFMKADSPITLHKTGRCPGPLDRSGVIREERTDSLLRRYWLPTRAFPSECLIVVSWLINRIGVPC